jgi:hypothetical protein
MRDLQERAFSLGQQRPPELGGLSGGNFELPSEHADDAFQRHAPSREVDTTEGTMCGQDTRDDQVRVDL